MTSIFISYSTSDANRLGINEVVNFLNEKPFIEEVIYWEGWSGYPDGNIVKFMEEGISRCSIFIPFFTKSYRSSENCMKEYETAMVINKKMIPVFESIEDVPLLCRRVRGVETRIAKSPFIIK